MAELCLSNKSQFPSLILSDFALFCSFIFSHPLYLSYFIFFSPYLLKLLSFLSPLFITTSLLLLALIFHNSSTPKLSDPAGSSFLLSAFRAIIDRLRPNAGQEEFHGFEESEAYKIVFLFEEEEEDTSTFDLIQTPFEVSELKPDENCLQALDPNLDANLEENPCKATGTWNLPLMEEIVDAQEHEQESKLRSGSDEAKDVNNDNTKKGTPPHAKLLVHQNDNEGAVMYKSNFESLGSNLGSYYGSMRKEKEWKRTLACKLFEERHNGVEGDEGMDSLWETYESDSSKSKRKDDAKKKKKKKKKSSSTETDYYGDEDDEEEEEEVLEMTNGQLCCLQAFKFSTGKMNLGMGRPNLVKISKALKGIGWLHHVKNRHSKKERS